MQYRLKKILSILNLSIKDCASRCGIPYRSFQDYLSGKNKPGADALLKITTELRVSLDWLLTGSGEMFKDDRNVEKSGKNKSLFYQRLEKIEIMLKDMDEEKQEAVLKYIQEKKRLGEMERQIEELQRRVDVA